MVFHSASTRETLRIGESLGKLLLPGDVIALVGDLGTGKTYFVKGVAKGAGVASPNEVSSPSFTLIQEYAGKIPFYHIDLYRLGSEHEAEELGLEDYLRGDAITAIEWADRILSLLPEEILWVRLHHTGKNTRSIEILPKGDRYGKLLTDLRINQ